MPYAIFIDGDEPELVFFRSNNTYSNGSGTAVDVNGNEYTGIIYSKNNGRDIEHMVASENDSSIPWYQKRGSIKKVRVAAGQTISPICMSKWFYRMTAVTSIDLTGFDTSNVTDMSWMFGTCNLTSIDVSGLNTANVTNMYGMFSVCHSLTSITFGGNFNTAKVTNMGGMFQDSDALTSVNLNSFNTAKVTNMSYMFSGCRALTSLDLRSFNTEKVTYPSAMFQNCTNLTSLDLSSFNLLNARE